MDVARINVMIVKVRSIRLFYNSVVHLSEGDLWRHSYEADKDDGPSFQCNDMYVLHNTNHSGYQEGNLDFQSVLFQSQNRLRHS